MWSNQLSVLLIIIVATQSGTCERHEVEARCSVKTDDGDLSDLSEECDSSQHVWDPQEEEEEDDEGYFGGSVEEDSEYGYAERYQDDDDDNVSWEELEDDYELGIYSDSGIDFIEDEHSIVDKDEFANVHYFTDHLANDIQFSLLEHVRAFIRRVKGLPGEKMLDEGIGSGNYGRDDDQNQDLEEKPAWCFFPYHLARLAKVEIKIYELLNEFYDSDMQNLPQPLPILVSYLNDFQRSSLQALIHYKSDHLKGNESNWEADSYLYIGSHPVLIYRMIRRFAEDLQPILAHLMDQHEAEDLVWDIYKKANKELLIFPDMEDLQDALGSLRRIQGRGLLKSQDLARGILEHVDTRVHFNSLQALEVGAFYYEDKAFDYAIEWIYYGLRSLRSNSAVIEMHPEIEIFFNSALEFVIHEHNAHWEKVHSDIWSPNVFNKEIDLPYEPLQYERMSSIRETEAAKHRHKQEWNWALSRNFDTVCSGISLLSEEEKARLKCWYEKSRAPYWFINPLKVEALSNEPQVLQVYEFIGNKMIQKIQTHAVYELKRSTVVDRSSPTKSVVDKTRTSTQMWLYDNHRGGEFLVPLTKRMELLSGFTILPPTACDAYQVATYGPSHHYAAHIDSFEDIRRSEEKGNRITTIMGYLSNVEVGGRTGFPVAGTFAEPVKGSIVMWNNLKRNGLDRDLRTWHGGCPVILGVKWITNKWVYYKDNFHDYPCSLDPGE